MVRAFLVLTPLTQGNESAEEKKLLICNRPELGRLKMSWWDRYPAPQLHPLHLSDTSHPYSINGHLAVREKVSLALPVPDQLAGNAAKQKGLNRLLSVSSRKCVSLNQYNPLLDIWAASGLC